MRQICVLQWEEIKTKKSGAMHLFFEGKGPKGWNKLGFCWTLISHQSFSFFPSTSVGALGLFTFLPQSAVHNMRIFELGVPVYSSLLLINLNRVPNVVQQYPTAVQLLAIHFIWSEKSEFIKTVAF